jgi:DNA-binding NarL/FixJ family response regulator
MNAPITVLLVDDDWSVRTAVRDYLLRRDFCVLEADCMESALATGIAQQPDVVVMDIVLPRAPGERADFDQHAGVDAARRLREELPQLGIVFLSAYVDRGAEVVRVFTAGHDRIIYLLKGSKPHELLDAIQTVARKLPVFNLVGVRGRIGPATQALQALGPDERACVLRALERLPSLSEPEARVFHAVGGCLTHKVAAERLGLSAKTISHHIDNIYDKLGLREANPGLNQLMLLSKTHLVHLLQAADAARHPG